MNRNTIRAQRRNVLIGYMNLLGLTQVELAEQLEMGTRQIRRYIANEVEVPLVVVLAIKALKFSYSPRSVK